MKYYLTCCKCGRKVNSFKEWFAADQKCPDCGCAHAEITYTADYGKLKELLKVKNVKNFYHYFDFLPVEKHENCISFGEGTCPIEEWDFMNAYAREKYGIECRNFVVRNDLSGGTGTFKDAAGSLGGSLFKENDVKGFCIASTGNTATAFGKYCKAAGVPYTVFVPCDIVEDSLNAIKEQGNTVVVSKGNYAAAKKECAAFHDSEHVLMSAGNIDPIRVESKRTLVFEVLRQLGFMPTVYMQAVAGGTGPIAFDKGFREIAPYFPDLKYPRMILAQQDLCDPMCQAWERANQKGFQEGWEKDYPVLDDPKTKISILSNGNPGMYVHVGPIVRKSGGTFERVLESETVECAKWVNQNKGVIFGPAAVVCIQGWLKALENGDIKNGDTVLLNTGEGSGRAKWFRDKVSH